jgi:hypothetical protein
MKLRAGITTAILCVLATGARADDRDTKARQHFEAGKQAYAETQYQRAYDEFKAAYLLSSQPALLYNMSTVLQQLNQPHAAAEKLSAYLRAVHDDPEQAAIEGRIRALDEAQRILDAEALKSQPALLRPLPPPPPPWYRRHKTALIIAGAAAAVVVGGAIGLGVGLRAPDYSASTLSAHRATP